jgi:hypothetical protein
MTMNRYLPWRLRSIYTILISFYGRYYIGVSTSSIFRLLNLENEEKHSGPSRSLRQSTVLGDLVKTRLSYDAKLPQATGITEL